MPILGQMFSAKLGPNLMTASKVLRSPLGQALVSFLVGYFVTTKLSQFYGKFKRDSEKSDESTQYLDKPPRAASEPKDAKGHDIVLLTQEELTAFDGSSPSLPIYTALNGLIYDLSPGREKFSSHGPYSLLAGCNANKVLNIACSSMGVCAANVIRRWEQSLRAEFQVVGYVVDAGIDIFGGSPEKHADSAKGEQTEQSDIV
ncbi:membrane steroid-binding protein 1 [Drosophila mauritiana]|uniref:Membrane steroid-binding protein 1 n=1 Tax=Drosophila mauritiana TaxID=7226 RepID=A0A6P8KEM9_DROMA|nr:membrane steroid-binding protein 1 [Drosophila mauritiana]